MRQLVAMAMIGAMAMGGLAQTPSSQDAGTAQKNAQGGFTLKVNANIVLTNVVVRDKKTGAVVKGLKESDFTIVEDKKQQTVRSFDYQSVDEGASWAACVTTTACPVRPVPLARKAS